MTKGARQAAPFSDGEFVAVQALIPRSAISVPSEMTSQLNCDRLGFNRRGYLEVIRRADFTPAVSPIGKLRFVDTAELVAWMKSHAVAKPAPELTNDAAELDDVSAAMVAAGGKVALVGRRRSA